MAISISSQTLHVATTSALLEPRETNKNYCDWYFDSCFRFVGYETMREAEGAIQKFDGFDLGEGHRLKVALALSKQKPAFGDLRDMSSNCANRRIHEHIEIGRASCRERV